MKKAIKSFLYLFVTLTILCGSLALYTYFALNSKLDLKKPYYLTIQKNQSVDSILDELAENNILTPKWLLKTYFKIYTRISGKKIYAGSYKFEKIHTNNDVIRAMVHGIQNNMVKVTYPEGITIRDFARISADRLGLNEDEFIRIAHSDSLLQVRHISGNSIEGYLMPATYIFFWEQSAGDVIKKLLDEQENVWKNHFADRAKALNKDKKDILTLASIVEAETPVIDERRRVAGVYQNRIKKGMRLEADPTVQYAVGEKKRLNYADLEVNSPYNTYKYKGLPPGPINNPSKSSIEAALNPESNSYIFFVAIGDGSGRHNFSANYSGHQAYVKEYRKNRKKR